MKFERFVDDRTKAVTYVVRPKDGESFSEWLMDDVDEKECKVDFPGGVVAFQTDRERMMWADGYSFHEKAAEGLASALTIIEGFCKSETDAARADRKMELGKTLSSVPAEYRQRVANIVERMK